MQEVRGHISRMLPLLVGNRFQVLFHSPHRGRQDYTWPALLESQLIVFAYGAVTRSGHSFQSVLLTNNQALAWSAFARHY